MSKTLSIEDFKLGQKNNHRYYVIVLRPRGWKSSNRKSFQNSGKMSIDERLGRECEMIILEEKDFKDYIIIKPRDIPIVKSKREHQ